jgi:hypothetical protein
MRAVMSPAKIAARLREASRLAGSLLPEDRLATKIDLTGTRVSARLKEASDLLDLCRALGRAGNSWLSRDDRLTKTP